MNAIAVNYTTELILPAYTIRHHAKTMCLVAASDSAPDRTDERADGKAYGILLCLQPYRPVPDRTTWKKWWQKPGLPQFAVMAGMRQGEVETWSGGEAEARFLIALPCLDSLT